MVMGPPVTGEVSNSDCYNACESLSLRQVGDQHKGQVMPMSEGKYDLDKVGVLA